MGEIKVFVETGKKKAFVGAVDWPGWIRSGGDEESALQALVDYGPRYAQVVARAGIELPLPGSTADLAVVERQPGNRTTDFGAPDAALASDTTPIVAVEEARFAAILEACWAAFDEAVDGARGRELQKGPRGGGRELEKIIEHVLEADRAYLRRVAQKHPRQDGENLPDAIVRMRGSILGALEVAARGELPAQGPRGGKMWTVRFFVRRVAYHVLDHAWEIEDRIVL
jgi:hypothetical protein